MIQQHFVPFHTKSVCMVRTYLTPQPSRRSLSLHLSLRSSSITPRVRTSLTPDWGHATATRRCVVGNKDHFAGVLVFPLSFALSTRVQATRKISLFSIFRRIHRMDSQANTLCIVRTYHTLDCDNPPASCRCATAMRTSFVVMAQGRPPCASSIYGKDLSNAS